MRLVLKCFLSGVVIVAGFVAARSTQDSEAGLAAIGTGGMRDLDARNQDIALYERRVVEDPASAADLAQLSGLYLQRAREAPDYEDFRRAEHAARRSVALRTLRNSRAQLVLSASLLAQHRFTEARTAAETLVSMDSSIIGYRALLAEIQMELGDYATAARSFAGLAHASEDLAVAPRLARWHEIVGRPGHGKRVLEKALATARRSDLPREQIAWFFLRMGDFELRHGALDDAEATFREGLRYEPNDFRLISGLARVEFARSNWRRAIFYALLAGDRADLSTLALLGDSYHALGEETAADRVFRDLETSALENPEPYNRQWTQYLLDHSRLLPQTVTLLKVELETRPDVLGHDQLAWAYYLSGDIPKARAVMQRALRMGTQDATLHFHAGEIMSAAADRDAARAHFETALKINPYFHPRQAQIARARLAELR